MKQKILNLLEAKHAKGLHEFIETLDILYHEKLPPSPFIVELIIRSSIALGHYAIDHANLLPSQIQRMRQTINAAQIYLKNLDNEEVADQYFETASQSYPFGCGEGCYTILPNSCKVGSGCGSGSGSLASVPGLAKMEHPFILNIIAKEITPWLEKQNA